MFISHPPVGDIVFFQWLPLEVCVCGGGAGAAGIWSGRLPSLTYKAHSGLSLPKIPGPTSGTLMSLRNCSSVQESKLLKN